MTRKKVNLTYISKESARRATFKKRKKGLIKKMRELTTLCDVEACAIIIGPNEDQPEVHPSPLSAARVLRRFQSMSETDRTKKMVDQEAFLRQRIAKANDQLTKLRRDNRQKEATRVMFQALASPGAAGPVLQGLTSDQLCDLGSAIDRSLQDVAKQIERLERRKKAAAAEAATTAPVLKEEVTALEVPVGWKRKRGPRTSRRARADVAEERVVREDPAGRQQSFMELMMSHQHHHENHIMNLNGATQWGNDRVFPLD